MESSDINSYQRVNGIKRASTFFTVAGCFMPALIASKISSIFLIEAKCKFRKKLEFYSYVVAAYGEWYSWSIMIQNCSLTTCWNSKKLKKLYALHSSIRAH